MENRAVHFSKEAWTSTYDLRTKNFETLKLNIVFLPFTFWSRTTQPYLFLSTSLTFSRYEYGMFSAIALSRTLMTRSLRVFR